MGLKINSKTKINPPYRELTIENLKNLFIYQMFMVSSIDEADINVRTIESYFSRIERDYCDINGFTNCDSVISEKDVILRFHCEAKFGVSDRSPDMNDIKDAMLHSGDMAKFIEDFSRELSYTYALHKNLLSKRN